LLRLRSEESGWAAAAILQSGAGRRAVTRATKTPRWRSPWRPRPATSALVQRSCRHLRGLHQQKACGLEIERQGAGDRRKAFERGSDRIGDTLGYLRRRGDARDIRHCLDLFGTGFCHVASLISLVGCRVRGCAPNGEWPCSTPPDGPLYRDRRVLASHLRRAAPQTDTGCETGSRTAGRSDWAGRPRAAADGG